MANDKDTAAECADMTKVNKKAAPATMPPLMGSGNKRIHNRKRGSRSQSPLDNNSAKAPRLVPETGGQLEVENQAPTGGQTGPLQNDIGPSGPSQTKSLKEKIREFKKAISEYQELKKLVSELEMSVGEFRDEIREAKEVALRKGLKSGKNE